MALAPSPRTSARSAPRRSAPSWALGVGDACFFVAGRPEKFYKFAGEARNKVGEELNLTAKDRFESACIVDFPMYEWNEEEKKVDISHNPFSMPQGGLEALDDQGPARHPRLPVLHRLQRRGAILGRHPQSRPEVMKKAFEIAGLPGERAAREVRRQCTPRLPVWRPSARRHRAGRRPHRHAAVQRAQHPRGGAVPR